MRLQERDADILRALSLQVRLISQAQLAAAWWHESPVGRASARRRMARLGAVGLIRCVRLRSRSLPLMKAPVVAWSPGDPDPPFGAVAWHLRSRWRGPARQRAAYCATRKTINLFGGPLRNRLGQGTQATHDLGVAQIFVRLKCRDRAMCELWMGEDVIARSQRSGKLPDAILVDAQRVPQKVLEFGSDYDIRRVEAFHVNCATKNLPYELW